MTCARKEWRKREKERETEKVIVQGFIVQTRDRRRTLACA